MDIKSQLEMLRHLRSGDHHFGCGHGPCICPAENYVGSDELVFALEAELAECRRQINEGMASQHRIEHMLGHALYGYSKEGLSLWGEHTAETLSTEAARKLSERSKWWATDCMAEYAREKVAAWSGEMIPATQVYAILEEAKRNYRKVRRERGRK